MSDSINTKMRSYAEIPSRKYSIKEIVVETFIHLMAWVVLYSLPVLLAQYPSQSQPSPLLPSYMILVSCMVTFYLNYLVFIRFFLFRGKYHTFYVVNVVLVLTQVFVLRGLLVGAPGFLRNLVGEETTPKDVFFFDVMMIRDGVIFALTVLLSVLIRLATKWRDAEMARHDAEQRRFQAELSNLKNQLNPHFLLNTLNNIYALVAIDGQRAQEALLKLSSLLRYLLYENASAVVPLEKEVEFLDNYVQLMRLRLPYDFNLNFTVHTSSVNRIQIAPMIFISLVENAFKHGVSSSDYSFIKVDIQEKGSHVILSIVNSNYPKLTNDKSGSGIGLELVRRRLELLYPNAYQWEYGVADDLKTYRSQLDIDTSFIPQYNN